MFEYTMTMEEILQEMGYSKEEAEEIQQEANN